MRLNSFRLPETLLFLLLLAALPTDTTAKRSPSKNAVLLSDIQSLTLRGGNAKTTHRRLPAIPQLKCVSPRALCDLHTIDVMRCENRGPGYDPDDVQWSCTASLPPDLRLGSTDVLCEGYSSPDDPYVLRGSCGVQYTLALTDLGERRYPHLAGGGGGSSWDWFGNNNYFDSDTGTDWAAYLFSLIFFSVLAWILYSACMAAYRNRTLGSRANRRGWGGGGGGGGGGWGGGGGGGGPGWQPWNDPPPPYPGTKNTQGEGWRPGFWTGLASGAAAGYFAGNRNNDNSNYRYGDRFAGRYDDRYESRRTGWGSGFSGSSGSSSSRGSGPSRTSSSASSARHESTGFGSTTRR